MTSVVNFPPELWSKVLCECEPDLRCAVKFSAVCHMFREIMTRSLRVIRISGHESAVRLLDGIFKFPRLFADWMAEELEVWTINRMQGELAGRLFRDHFRAARHLVMTADGPHYDHSWRPANLFGASANLKSVTWCAKWAERWTTFGTGKPVFHGATGGQDISRDPAFDDVDMYGVSIDTMCWNQSFAKKVESSMFVAARNITELWLYDECIPSSLAAFENLRTLNCGQCMMGEEVLAPLLATIPRSARIRTFSVRFGSVNKIRKVLAVLRDLRELFVDMVDPTILDCLPQILAHSNLEMVIFSDPDPKFFEVRIVTSRCTIARC